MKTALVIGVSGQDGSYLARFLINKGYRVVGTSRDAQMNSFRNLTKLGINDDVIKESMNLNDFRSVMQVLNKEDFDEIYNLGGQSSVGLSFNQPMDAFESISIGTLNLLECIRLLRISAKLYNAGSSECFGNTNGEAANELTSFRPRSPYAMAKSAAFWAVENYREAYNLFACTGILFNHESPLRPERFVTRKIIKAACNIAKGKQYKLKLGNIDIQRDWGWAPEYVEAMWLMLQMEVPDDYIIATGRTISLKDFVKLVFKKLDLDWERYLEFNSELLRPTDILVSKSDPRKARENLGWYARFSVEDLIGMMIEEEMSN